MIKAAELLFKANEAQKPTILLMIDRNELEDQMLKNLASVGSGKRRACGSNIDAQQVARREGTGLSRNHRHDDSQVPRHACGPEY